MMLIQGALFTNKVAIVQLFNGRFILNGAVTDHRARLEHPVCATLPADPCVPKYPLCTYYPDACQRPERYARRWILALMICEVLKYCDLWHSVTALRRISAMVLAAPQKCSHSCGRSTHICQLPPASTI